MVGPHYYKSKLEINYNQLVSFFSKNIAEQCMHYTERCIGKMLKWQ